jgi:hypothetical protein
MPEERKYSVECRNPACREPITFARYITRSQRANQFASSTILMPGKLKCQMCGQESDYTQVDVNPAAAQVN